MKVECCGSLFEYGENAYELSPYARVAEET